MPSIRLSRLFPYVACLLAIPAGAATITVNSAADTVADDGQCTFREALAAANNNHTSGATAGECAAGQPSPAVDVIKFAITAGSGVRTITPLSNLPVITEVVTIDGYTQPGSSVNTASLGDNAVLLIEIDARNLTQAPIDLGGPFNGDSSGTTIRGLVIDHLGPVIGIDDGGGFGNGANNITIRGNFVGVDPTGLTMNGNSADALHCESGDNRIIGGPALADRNIIATGGSSGIDLNNCTNGVIQGNYIGIDATGLHAIGTQTQGIFATQRADGTLIGGSNPGEGNVIYGVSFGVNFRGDVNNNTIQGNYVGTDATGETGLGPTFGISLEGANNNVIGGVGAGNVLSGNSIALFIGNAPGTIVQGNFIGTGPDGASPVPNSLGIDLGSGTTSGNGIIGGTQPGEGNVIANSCTFGIEFNQPATNWPILGNSIHDSSLLGISFAPSSPQPFPNDAGDADTGANNLQNYPVLSSAQVSGGVATISGSLNSVANQAYRLEFFSSVDCNKLGAGEGRTFLGFANVTTDNNGNVNFGPLTFSGAPNNQTAFAATATDPNGNTSEFSMCLGGIGRIFAAGFEPQCGG